MKKARSRTLGLRRIARRWEIEPELRELLDHLGRLLAKEYVRALVVREADRTAARSEE